MATLLADGPGSEHIEKKLFVLQVFRKKKSAWYMPIAYVKEIYLEDYWFGIFIGTIKFFLYAAYPGRVSHKCNRFSW